ncbi:MAG: hypothetical protein J7K51_02525, partial [Thermotogae bacterium]|nr:hypothetical protein [Thermotogota bacterium]
NQCVFEGSFSKNTVFMLCPGHRMASSMLFLGYFLAKLSLIQKKRTKEKVRANTKFAKILRKNAENNRLASLRQYHFLNAFFLEFLNANFVMPI